MKNIVIVVLSAITIAVVVGSAAFIYNGRKVIAKASEEIAKASLERAELEKTDAQLQAKFEEYRIQVHKIMLEADEKNERFQILVQLVEQMQANDERLLQENQKVWSKYFAVQAENESLKELNSVSASK
jgi:hypothetical protein